MEGSCPNCGRDNCGCNDGSFWDEYIEFQEQLIKESTQTDKNDLVKRQDVLGILKNYTSTNFIARIIAGEIKALSGIPIK